MSTSSIPTSSAASILSFLASPNSTTGTTVSTAMVQNAVSMADQASAIVTLSGTSSSSEPLYTAQGILNSELSAAQSFLTATLLKLTPNASSLARYAKALRQQLR